MPNLKVTGKWFRLRIPVCAFCGESHTLMVNQNDLNDRGAPLEAVLIYYPGGCSKKLVVDHIEHTMWSTAFAPGFWSEGNDDFLSDSRN